MITFFARRILTAIPVVFLVTILVFLVMNVLPGDPAERAGGDSGISDEAAQRIRVELGLDKPIITRYFTWMGELLRGDFGRSIPHGTPVGKMITHALPTTLELSLFAIIIMIAIGIPLGVLAAYFKNSPIDTLASLIGAMGIAVPGFWLGILLIYLFSVTLGWLPATGFEPVWESPIKGLKYAVLPSFTLAAPGIAIMTRQTRSALMDVLREDYVRTARAKGLLNLTILTRHAFRNAMIPVMTTIGIQLTYLLGGSVVVETVFAIPGIGRLITDAIFFRDYPVVQSAAVVIVIMVVLVNIFIDFAYSLLNPRIGLSH
jgi:peptide/nickel transport system permease protein